MEINTEKWGQESEWQVETNLSTATWQDTNLFFYLGKYADLREYRTNGVFDYNTPIDYSIAYGGHASDTKMPLADIAIYNYQKTKKYSLEADNGWFFATQVSSSESDFQYYQLLTAFETGSPTNLAEMSGAYRWSPDAVNYSDYYPRPYNPNRLIRPIVKFSPKSFFGVVFVELVKNDNSGMTTVSLKTLKNNINTYKDTYTISKAYMRMYGYNGRVSQDGNYNNYTAKSLTNMGPCMTTPIPIGSKEFIAYNNTMGQTNANFPIAGTMETTHSYSDSGGNGHYGVIVKPQYTDSGGGGEIMAGVVMNHLVEDTQVDYFYSRSYGYMYTFRVKIPITAEVVEELYKGAAAYGFFFSDDVNGLNVDTSNVARWLNENMYCGVLDDNGIGHGEYTKGFANASNPVFLWDSNQDSSFDPSKPPSPTPSGDPIYPFSPGLTLAGAGTGLWAMTRTDVKETINDIFGTEAEKLKDKLALFGNNPMNAIISLKWYPMAFSSTLDGPVILGTVNVNNSHTYPVINSTANSVYENSGTLNIMNAYEKNFYNSRNIQARLWLPFYGFYELPSSILLSKQIELTLHYNLPDELAVWIISFDNVIYDYCECSMGIDIPLSGSNAAAISEAKRQAALSIASQIASTAATAIIGGSVLKGATGAAKYLAQGIDVVAEEALGYGLETEAYLGWKGLNSGFAGVAGQAAGIAAGAAGSGIGIGNTIHQTRLEIAALRTNIPFHGAAGQTTFLNLPMYPYIQIFRNNIMGIYDEDEYKLKVGHACDVWKTLNNMPEESLLQTTGVANMSSMGMEIQEYQELNSILQTGFFR